jgi:hypothetical protein
MHTEGNYKNDGIGNVYHGGLDDHEDDGVIGARVIFPHNLLHQASHGEQTTRHEDRVRDSEPHFEGEVG